MRKPLWYGLLGALAMGLAGMACLAGTAAGAAGGVRAMLGQVFGGASPIAGSTPYVPYPGTYAYPWPTAGWNAQPIMRSWEGRWAYYGDCYRDGGWIGWGMGMGSSDRWYDAVPVQPPSLAPSTQTAPSYSQDVQPIFDERCIACHGGTLGLYLTEYGGALRGSASGPVIIPGDPQSSRLIQYVLRGYMPYGGPPLTGAQIQTLVDWVAAGAPDN